MKKMKKEVVGLLRTAIRHYESRGLTGPGYWSVDDRDEEEIRLVYTWPDHVRPRVLDPWQHYAGEAILRAAGVRCTDGGAEGRREWGAIPVE